MLRSIKVMLTVFLLSRLADFGTTLWAIQKEQHILSETNMFLFILGNNIFSMIAVQFVLIFIVIYFFSKVKHPFAVYSIITTMIWHVLVTALAVRNALQHVAAPVPMEVAAQVTSAEKLATYTSIIIPLQYAPLIIAIIVYFIFKLDFDFIPKEIKK